MSISFFVCQRQRWLLCYSGGHAKRKKIDIKRPINDLTPIGQTKKLSGSVSKVGSEAPATTFYLKMRMQTP
jgi:hypothetical protein